jgi:hypothetical protein
LSEDPIRQVLLGNYVGACNLNTRWKEESTKLHTSVSALPVSNVGETGVKRDTGSKGTVGGKIVDVNKTVKIFSMLCKSV